MHKLPRTGGHVFWERVNRVLEKKRFDRFAEAACEKCSTPAKGRPGVLPGVYFRMRLVVYCKGLDPEHGIAWRRADSLSLHEFSGCADQDRAGLFDGLAHTAADRSGNEPGSVMRDYSRSSNTQRVVQIEGTQNCGHRFTTASRAMSPRSTSLPACMSTIQQSARSIRRLRIVLSRAVIITGVPHGTPQLRDSSNVHRRRSNS